MNLSKPDDILTLTGIQRLAHQQSRDAGGWEGYDTYPKLHSKLIGSMLMVCGETMSKASDMIDTNEPAIDPVTKVLIERAAGVQILQLLNLCEGLGINVETFILGQLKSEV